MPRRWVPCQEGLERGARTRVGDGMGPGHNAKNVLGTGRRRGSAHGARRSSRSAASRPMKRSARGPGRLRRHRARARQRRKSTGRGRPRPPRGRNRRRAALPRGRGWTPGLPPAGRPSWRPSPPLAVRLSCSNGSPIAAPGFYASSPTRRARCVPSSSIMPSVLRGCVRAPPRAPRAGRCVTADLHLKARGAAASLEPGRRIGWGLLRRSGADGATAPGRTGSRGARSRTRAGAADERSSSEGRGRSIREEPLGCRRSTAA